MSRPVTRKRPRRAIDDIFAGDPDQRFEFGLDIILRGLGTYAAGTTASGAAQAAAVANKRNGGTRRERHGS